MKKGHIIGLGFLVVLGCWWWSLRGHIGYWGETDFFQRGSVYWSAFATQPGGWTDYAANFLLQFYRWSGVGALLQTATVMLIYGFCRKIVLSLKIRRGGLFLSHIPWVLVFMMQVKSQMMLSESLKMVLFFGFILLYFRLKHRGWHCGLFTLIAPAALLLLGDTVFFALYVNLALLEGWREKNKGRWGVMLWWAVSAVLVPWIWHRWVWTGPAEASVSLQSADGWPRILMYGYLLILWSGDRICSWLFKGRKRVGLELALAIAGAFIAFGCVYNWKAERFLRMELATVGEKWEDVLKYGAGIDQPERKEIFLVNLALANQGKLGEQLLEYPSEWGIGGLYLPRDMSYEISMLGSHLYTALEIPNEAIHWTFQAAVASPQGMDFRTLKRLIELNRLKRDSLLTEKYLAVLENAVGFGSWCREQRRLWDDTSAERLLPQEKIDFFIGGRPFLSDMARILDAGKSKEIVSEYILCGLLLDKELGKFSQLMRIVYPTNDIRLPQIYQEAVLVAIEVGDRHLAAKNYPIDPQVRQRFREYSSLYQICKSKKLEAPQMMKEYKHTWWYYFHFITPKPMDQQGHVMPFIYSL